MNSPAPLDNSATFLQQLDKLQQELSSQLPGYEYSLREIHRNLSSDPALLHILKPEQIGTIVAALKKKTNTIVVEETVKKAGRGGKRAKEITEDDI